jgi:putative ABC transport system permease protein
MGWTRFFRRRQWDRERALEMEAYLDLETQDNVARGMPREEARHAARRKLGNLTSIREEIYRMNSIGPLETFWQDCRYSLRVLRKSPGFSLVAILSLALGIGANSACFSVIHAVLLRPLPYPTPDRLVRVVQLNSAPAVSIPEYRFWKEHATVFASAAGDRGTSDRFLTRGGRQEWIKAQTVTADFFRTLGVTPALGREFNAEETRAGGPQAIVLSDTLWRRAFGGDPAILGSAVALDGNSFTVTGVLPAGFWYPQFADAFVPLRPTNSLSDTGLNTEMIARLKPDVTLRQAEAEMAALTESIRRAYPENFSQKYRGLTLVPYQKSLSGDVRVNLLLLFGAVMLLLLIACSNLASLLLARLAARQKEVAMRLALGSSRGRLLRQFLIENILLTTIGGLAGLFCAYAALDTMVAAIPFHLPASAPIRLNLPVLAFTLAIAFGTGIMFSLAPILTASRLDLQDALKTGGRSTGGGGRQRVRSILIVGEIALSVTLLVAAGLLVQTLYRLHREPLGFSPRGLVTFSTPFAAERRRNAADQLRYRNSLQEQFQALPGVRSVAAVNVLPLNGFTNLPTERDGHPENSIGGMEVRYITEEYFDVMGIPIRRGRAFLNNDQASSPPVILVNETVARQWWPKADPIGDRVVIGRFQGRNFGDPIVREVVGVVADTKSRYLKDPPRPTVYVPASQNPDAAGGVTWILRADAGVGLAGPVRRAIAEIDSRQRIGTIRTMDEIVAATTASSRFDAWLFASLAGLALALTAIGVYGLLSFSVARRRNEIGTRMALGASRWRVLMLVLKQGLALIGLGLVLGLAAALAVTRWLETLLFGVRTTDPMSFIGVSVLLLATGLFASYFPARRATLVDPIVALRQE